MSSAAAAAGLPHSLPGGREKPALPSNLNLNLFSPDSSDEEDRMSLFGHTEVDGRRVDDGGGDKPAESRIRSL